MNISISVPADDEGYIALRCPTCRGEFKVLVADFEQSAGQALYCAQCGMATAPSSFIPPDVLNMAILEVRNQALDAFGRMFRDMEQRTRNSPFLHVTAGNVEHVPLPKLRAVTDLAITDLPCCKTTVKVPFARAAALYYCPLCGHVQD